MSTSVKVSVNELYPSIQGESTHSGRPCTFVRLAGCPLHCTWCDTEYSFTSGQKMTVEEIIAQVRSIGLPLVEVTGGEPLAQKSCSTLLQALCEAGFEVLLETSGAYPFKNLDARVTVIADLKCPGSGESERNLLGEMCELRSKDELKIVVADDADVQWALTQLRGPLKGCRAKVLWSAVAGQMAPAHLAKLILQYRAPGRLQIQLHKVLWPDVDRGV
ncbi:MAG TPA: 7-carboxy-7-deazaguanine synthase QueE [Myxococcales bacterium]|nr:7-carboxy-7-deazaguanine synthase QueE [Myxococcales bacterium]HAN30133.1 7-carboxy-7-deazaguanine synthase QueE [Myxococcales bacterium]